MFRNKTIKECVFGYAFILLKEKDIRFPTLYKLTFIVHVVGPH